MPSLIGVFAALTVGVFATKTRLDRDGAFYSTVVIVVASYYVLFAVMGASAQTLVIELFITGVFAVAAVIGFRLSPWLVCAALAAHGVLDAVHGRLIDNPGVPAWWPAWCAAYDVVAAGYLAWRIGRARSGAPAREVLIVP